MPWLRRLVAGLSPRRRGFDPSSFRVRFVVEKMTLGWVLSKKPQFSPVSVIPPMLHIHHHLHVPLTRRTNGRSLRTFQKEMLFRKSGSKRWRNTCFFSSLFKVLMQLQFLSLYMILCFLSQISIRKYLDYMFEIYVTILYWDTDIICSMFNVMGLRTYTHTIEFKW
jgi:hypothetical protein